MRLGDTVCMTHPRTKVREQIKQALDGLVTVGTLRRAYETRLRPISTLDLPYAVVTVAEEKASTPSAAAGRHSRPQQRRVSATVTVVVTDRDEIIGQTLDQLCLEVEYALALGLPDAEFVSSRVVADEDQDHLILAASLEYAVTVPHVTAPAQ